MYSNCLRLASVATESPRLAASMVLKIRSVTPPTADTTTMILALAAARLTISAHWRKRSALPTDVPPNFITINRFLLIALLVSVLLLLTTNYCLFCYCGAIVVGEGKQCLRADFLF